MKFEIVEERTIKETWILEVEAKDKQEALSKYNNLHYKIIDQEESEVLESKVVEIRESVE